MEQRGGWQEWLAEDPDTPRDLLPHYRIGPDQALKYGRARGRANGGRRKGRPGLPGSESRVPAGAAVRQKHASGPGSGSHALPGSALAAAAAAATAAGARAES